MRILLTNITLCDGSGTETLIRDLSAALRWRGHRVICFAPTIGRLAAEIRATGTPVVQSLAAVAEAPDIIHGHHSGPTMMALTRFRSAAAVFVCHDWSSVYDDPPRHPRIGRYLYVRHVLRDRLVSERGIPPGRVKFWGNTIDLTRVDKPRSPPPRPRTAGVYCHVGRIPFLPLLAAACATHGIEFRGEVLRQDADRHHVESALSGCDLVFASGRMAIEAIAAGCAVVNADHFGIGGLVTSARLNEFVGANFALGALSMPASEQTIRQALEGYDSLDAAAVTARVRQDCDVAAGAARLEAIYREILDEAAAGAIDRAIEDVELARYLEENLQYGRLYHGEFARRIYTPIPSQELHATVRKLEVQIEQLSCAIDELSRQTRDLSHGRLGAILMFVLRSVRARTRQWLARVRFQGGPRGRNSSGPGKPGAVPGAQNDEGAAGAPIRPH